MSLRNSRAFTFRPKGLSDAVDGSNAFPGAMQILQDLIPSQDTQDLWAPRPASVELSTFTGFTTPGFVSASLVVGDIEYGMVASGLHAGKDQPFAYNIKTNTYLTVTGIIAGNVPTSPATSGEWVPPIMALVGTRVVVTHPGFAGGATKFGWFDISRFSYTGSMTTNSAALLTSVTNLLQAGVQPGQFITKADVPAGTFVVSIAADGLSLIMSAGATNSTTSATTIAGGTPVSPQWGAGDTNIFGLPSTPVSVAQFNGRAYYACGNGVVWSDSLLACNRTNANQAETFGNGLPVTALGALPLSSPVTGGIIQAIIAFQGVSALQQITGDQATNNFAANQMNVATGTQSPLSITPTNVGLAFISPEGLRIIGFAATVSDPIGDAGKGVAVPFLYAVNPSRICAAANADVLRISTKNGAPVVAVEQEYWFDLSRKIWSGPHTFPASLIQPWQDTFVIHPISVVASTWRSDVQLSSTSAFVENGVQMGWVAKTVLLPDNDSMAMNSTIETTVSMAMPGGYSLTITAVDEQANLLGAVTLRTTGTATIWGAFTWGAAPWSGNTAAFRQYAVPWAEPLVYKQASLILQGSSVVGIKMGDSRFKYEQLGYMLGDPYVLSTPTPPVFVLDRDQLDGGGALG